MIYGQREKGSRKMCVYNVDGNTGGCLHELGVNLFSSSCTHKEQGFLFVEKVVFCCHLRLQLGGIAYSVAAVAV